jgi:hypothetical protein
VIIEKGALALGAIGSAAERQYGRQPWIHPHEIADAAHRIISALFDRNIESPTCDVARRRVSRHHRILTVSLMLEIHRGKRLGRHTPRPAAQAIDMD